MTSRTLNSSRRGFSLVELLMVVAGIGVICSIAVLMIGNRHYVDSREAVARKNAQQFVSLVIMAQAAGKDPVKPTVIETLQELKTGVTVTGGIFDGQTIRCAGVAQKDMERAAYYLEVANGQLSYLAAKETNRSDW